MFPLYFLQGDFHNATSVNALTTSVNALTTSVNALTIAVYGTAWFPTPAANATANATSVDKQITTTSLQVNEVVTVEIPLDGSAAATYHAMLEVTDVDIHGSTGSQQTFKLARALTAGEAASMRKGDQLLIHSVNQDLQSCVVTLDADATAGNTFTGELLLTRDERKSPGGGG